MASSKKSGVRGRPVTDTSYRFPCLYPGCQRTFSELWRLRVHFRASPDIRGSGKERGHGVELDECPRCGQALVPGKIHVNCIGGHAAPRQAAKRRERQGQQVAAPQPMVKKQHAQPGQQVAASQPVAKKARTARTRPAHMERNAVAPRTARPVATHHASSGPSSSPPASISEDCSTDDSRSRGHEAAPPASAIEDGASPHSAPPLGEVEERPGQPCPQQGLHHGGGQPGSAAAAGFGSFPAASNATHMRGAAEAGGRASEECGTSDQKGSPLLSWLPKPPNPPPAGVAPPPSAWQLFPTRAPRPPPAAGAFLPWRSAELAPPKQSNAGQPAPGAASLAAATPLRFASTDQAAATAAAAAAGAFVPWRSPELALLRQKSPACAASPPAAGAFVPWRSAELTPQRQMSGLAAGPTRSAPLRSFGSRAEPHAAGGGAFAPWRSAEPAPRQQRPGSVRSSTAASPLLSRPGEDLDGGRHNSWWLLVSACSAAASQGVTLPRRAGGAASPLGRVAATPCTSELPPQRSGGASLPPPSPLRVSNPRASDLPPQRSGGAPWTPRPPSPTRILNPVTSDMPPQRSAGALDARQLSVSRGEEPQHAPHLRGSFPHAMPPLAGCRVSSNPTQAALLAAAFRNTSAAAREGLGTLDHADAGAPVEEHCDGDKAGEGSDSLTGAASEALTEAPSFPSLPVLPRLPHLTFEQAIRRNSAPAASCQGGQWGGHGRVVAPPPLLQLVSPFSSAAQLGWTEV